MIKISRIIHKLCLSVGVSLLLTTCNQSGTQYTDTPIYGKIKMASDETLQPICSVELQVFESLYQYAKIKPAYMSEQEAFKALIADSIRLIIASRKLNANERGFFEAKRIYPRESKIAIDALALIINPKNSDSILSVKTVKDILTGNIQQWKQLNKKSKLGDIQIVFDNPSSSTVRFIIDSITKGSALSKNVSALKYNKEVIDYVSRNSNALGIIGVSWISDPSDSASLTFLKKVQVVALSKEENATYDNSYKPLQAYVAQKMYPWTRDVYVINAEPRQGLASGFAAFLASSKGQLIIKRAGVLPATAPIRIIHVRNDF
jgi:phosphate transport system substrate-binding protein